MSDFCEVSESFVLATSTCPATDVIMLRIEAANGASSLVAAPQPQGVVVSAALGASEISGDGYAVLLSSGAAMDVATPGAALTTIALSTARGRSSTVQGFGENATSVAAALGSAPFAQASSVVTSSAVGASTASGSTEGVTTVVSSAVARSSFLAVGLFEMVLTTAAAADGATGTLLVSQFSFSEAGSADSAYPSAARATLLAIGDAAALSAVVVQTDLNVFATSVARAAEEHWYQDPDAKAWIMNTESTAVSWYDRFDFESLASWDGREFATGPDGVYELTGPTDAGSAVAAEVVSGFTDFGTQQTKRLDSMYFGYTSEGQLTTQVEVYESGHPPMEYVVEERAAAVPRNTRVTPGKGLWGRYWRLAFKNTDGADFTVLSASVDIAPSTRRI